MDGKPLAPGTRVRIVDREPTSADAKSRLFYSHFRNLTGTVRRVFADGAEVEVVIDLESLPEDIRTRHLSAQDAMRKRISESLSGEARERTGSDAGRLNLRYSVLVSPKDLVPIGGSSRGRTGSAKAEAKPQDAPAPSPAQSFAEAKEARPQAAPTGPPAPSPPRTRKSEQRITEQELSRREEQLLKSKQKGKR